MPLSSPASSGRSLLASESNESTIQRLTLRHHNGDERTVKVRVALTSWSLVLVWGDLAGEVALNLRSGCVHAYGKGGGVKRYPMVGWCVKDLSEARKLYEDMVNV